VDGLMVALLVGAVAIAAVLLGWFLGSRPAAASRSEAAEARERLTSLEREHAVASEQVRRAIQVEESVRVYGGGARRSAHCAAILSVLLGTLILTVLLSTRNVIGGLFNDDKRVIALVADVIPYVALFQIADGLNGSCGGALRGMGRQSATTGLRFREGYTWPSTDGVWLGCGWGSASLCLLLERWNGS